MYEDDDLELAVGHVEPTTDAELLEQVYTTLSNVSLLDKKHVLLDIQQYNQLMDALNVHFGKDI